MHSAIRETYSGPLDLATDFMTWNVTKDGVRTRMAVPNHDAYPAPIQMVKQPPDSAAEFPFSAFDRESIDVPAARVTNQVIKKFNEENGTNVFPAYTGMVDKPEN